MTDTNAKVTEITINGIVYVPKDQATTMAQTDGMSYVIIRTFSAGVHAGYLKCRDGKEVELVNARRIWYWDGAASLSQMAVSGVSKPQNCKFSVPVASIVMTEAIEIIPCTDKAMKSIQGVSEWTAYDETGSGSGDGYGSGSGSGSGDGYGSGSGSGSGDGYGSGSGSGDGSGDGYGSGSGSG